MAAALLVILAGVFVLSLRTDSHGADAIELVVDEQPQEPVTIVVHVTGQVMRPGLYRVGAGARVADAVTAAGGFSVVADTETVNLAAVLNDGQQVLIPKKPETVSAPLPAHEQSVAAPVDSQPVADRRPPQNTLSASGMSQVVPQSATIQRKININHAQPDELQKLPGIGTELARRICYYRYENGYFTRVDDLAKVDGIGAATVEKLRPYITL